MARSNPDLITALRETANRLHDGAPYSWSLLGSCNCGHLAQTITGLTSTEIQSRALEATGDWSEQVMAYCPSSGVAMEDVFSTMLSVGMARVDVAHLEKLSDPIVLDRIPHRLRPLDHRKLDDVVLYMRTWAHLLEETLLPSIRLPRHMDRRSVLSYPDASLY